MPHLPQSSVVSCHFNETFYMKKQLLLFIIFVIIKQNLVSGQHTNKQLLIQASIKFETDKIFNKLVQVR